MRKKKSREVFKWNVRSSSFGKLSIEGVLHLLDSEQNCLLLKHRPFNLGEKIKVPGHFVKITSLLSVSVRQPDPQPS